MKIPKSKLVELIYSAFPNSYQVKNLDIDTENDAIRFDFWNVRWRVSVRLSAEEVEGGCLKGGGYSMIVEKLLKTVAAGQMEYYYEEEKTDDKA